MLKKIYEDPNIFQIDVPLPDNPLRNLNCYIIQDGGSGGREAGNTFKPGIYQTEFAAPEHIRKHSENEGQQPRKHYGKESVPQRKRRHLSDEDERECTCYQRDNEADKKRAETGIPSIKERNNKRKSHEQGAHKKRLADIC